MLKVGPFRDRDPGPFGTQALLELIPRPRDPVTTWLRPFRDPDPGPFGAVTQALLELMPRPRDPVTTWHRPFRDPDPGPFGTVTQALSGPWPRPLWNPRRYHTLIIVYQLSFVTSPHHLITLSHCSQITESQYRFNHGLSKELHPQ